MKVVLVASQKGGAGKTTLAANLGVAAVAAGQRCLLVDLDPQGSLRGWWVARDGDAPSMLDRDPAPAEILSVLPRLADQFDLVVIDTPPAASVWLVDMMARVDLVLVPVRPSPYDLRAIGATLRDLNSSRARFAFVLSSAPRSKIVDTSVRALARHGRVAPVNLGQRVVYAECGATGQGVLEAADRRAAEEVSGLWQFVLEDLANV